MVVVIFFSRLNKCVWAENLSNLGKYVSTEGNNIENIHSSLCRDLLIRLWFETKLTTCLWHHKNVSKLEFKAHIGSSYYVLEFYITYFWNLVRMPDFLSECALYLDQSICKFIW